MDKSIRRYELIVNHPSGRKVLISMNEEYEKDFLSEIDLYTMAYQNQAEFLYHHRDILLQEGISDFEKCYISVNFQYNEETRKENPVFADKKYLRQFAEGAETYMEPETGKMFCDAVFKQMLSGPVAHELLNDKLLDKYLRDAIYEYIFFEQTDYHKERITDNLKRYKTVRRFLPVIKKIESMAERKIFHYQEKQYEDDLEKRVTTSDQASIFEYGIEETKTKKKGHWDY